MKISVIIPSYNTPREYMEVLYQSLLNQTFDGEYEVIIVDDCSTVKDYSMVTDSRFHIIANKKNSGPAYSRNHGAEAASGEILFFTDSDCEVDKDTLKNIAELSGSYECMMGNTITKTKTWVGKCVAYLGFPGGGNIGFHNVWKVTDGYTDSISSCNLAIRRALFFELGGFDTTFPVPGGEDTWFAKNMVQLGHRIKYQENQVVYHVERGDYKGFLRWQITRGRGNYHIKRKLGKVNGFFKLRLWSFKNSIIKSRFYAPIVIYLIFVSALYQTIGLKQEKKRMEGGK